MGRPKSNFSVDKDIPSKSWFVVFNNPENHGYKGSPEEIINQLRDEWIQLRPTGSGAWAYCISANGLHHVHMVLEDIKSMRFNSIKSSYAVGSHFEKTRGNKTEAEDYINKKGKWEESGEIIVCSVTYGEIRGAQGRRTDLYHMYDLVKAGFSDFEIIEENPDYLKHLSRIRESRELYLNEKYKNTRRENMHVEYWYGPPGSGKTRSILDMYGDSNVYVVSDYDAVWDGYSGQDIVLFDNFDADRLRPNDLTRWLDIYPLQLHCRFTNKTACYTKVYFTHHQSFDDVFHWLRIHHGADFISLQSKIHVFKRFNSDGSISQIGDQVDQHGFMQISEQEQKEIDEMFGS